MGPDLAQTPADLRRALPQEAELGRAIYRVEFSRPVTGEQISAAFERVASSRDSTPMRVERIKLHTAEGIILGINSPYPDSSFVMLGSGNAAAIKPEERYDVVTLRHVDWNPHELKFAVYITSPIPDRLALFGRVLLEALSEG